MPEPPRTVKYEGMFPSQTRERFEEDARTAASDDWYPVAESWQGTELFVTYEHDPVRPQRAPTPPAGHGPKPSASTGEPPTDGMPRLKGPEPPWRRALLGLVVAGVVVMSAGVAMIGFGAWDRPGSLPNQVRFVSPAPGGLGGRPAAVSYLQAHGFDGVLTPTGDGQERWFGRDAAGSIVELVGPATDMARVALTVFPTQDVGVGEVAQPTEVLVFLDRFVPSGTDWANAHTDDALAAGGAPVRQRFGDRILAMAALAGADDDVFTYSISGADPPARQHRTGTTGVKAHTFGDGTWMIDSEVRPGTYRATADGTCSWARLRGTSGTPEDVLANGASSGSVLLTIGKRDVAVTSSGCGRWTSDLSRVTADRTAFGDGMYLVGTDVVPGSYVSSGTGSCSWARLSGFDGTPDEVIASEVLTGPRLVTIRGTDKGFRSSGCGGWIRQ
jgi:hypothetical protein